MAKLAHVEGEEFFRVFDLLRAGRLRSVVSESLSAASLEISISYSLQIGQNVTSQGRLIQGSSGENELWPSAEK